MSHVVLPEQASLGQTAEATNRSEVGQGAAAAFRVERLASAMKLVPDGFGATTHGRQLERLTVILSNTVYIAAPIERVWSLTEDIEKWPVITPTMTSIVRLDSGPLQVGSTARVKQPRQRARVWTVTRFDPNDTFAWQSRILGMPVVGTHSMASQGDGSTVNTLTLEMSGVMSRLMGRILASTLRQALATENAGFKQHAEQ